MKKVLLLVWAVVLALNVSAEEFNTSQKRFLDSMKKYLASKEINAEFQDDGLKFKEDGKTYYLELDKSYDNPMFVCLRRYLNYTDLLTKEYVLNHFSNINTKFCVKVIPQDKYLVFSAEMFFNESDQFESSFPDFFRLLKLSVGNVE